MGRHVHFEVHVQQNGRWSIHAQFQSHQRDKAVEEAKKIEKTPGFSSVKVVKEVFDGDEGTHRDYTIYRGRQGEADEEHKGFRDIGDTGDSGDGGDDDGTNWMTGGDDDDFDDDYEYDDDDTPKKRKKNSKPIITAGVTHVIVRMLLIALVSLLVAGGFAALFSWWFHGKELMGIKMVGNAEANAIFATFVLTFLATASVLAFNYFKNVNLKSKQRAAKGGRGAPRTSGGGGLFAALLGTGAQPAPATAQPREGTIHDWRDQAKAEMSDDERQKMEAAATGDRLKAELEQQAAAEAQAAGDSKRAIILDADKVNGGTPAPEPMDANAEKQKAYMMKFLGQVLEVTGSDKKKLDNFTKFGVNLFLAGACESLAQKRGLDVNARSRILSDSVQVLGFKKSHAGAFADRYEEYLLQDARYMSMFQAGRNAMSSHSVDDVSGPSHMKAALEEWNKPKPKQEQARVIAVMFTDIAGSTALTQQLGDAGAQEVVRAHNKIVREALTRYQGREVKHTGDGMMMSFDQPTNAVEAAIAIQRDTVSLRQSDPAKPLKIKIGINAGEPIAEDNDLFGTTVQLAARIVDKAKADEIYVSDTVKGICTGKGYKFQSRGGFAMKGFSEDINLYEVVWSSSKAA